MYGTLEVFAESIAHVGAYLWVAEGYDGLEYGDLESKRFQDEFKVILTNCFRERPQVMARLVPTVHTYAALHAQIRWNVARSFRVNDTADIGHAAAAVPYCNCFATERSLASLIGEAKLNREYGISVVSTSGLLLAWILQA